MALKTLNEHNAEVEARRVAEYKAWEESKRNGIACPNCGKELSDYGNMNMSSTGKKMRVHCSSCGYDYFREA